MLHPRWKNEKKKMKKIEELCLAKPEMVSDLSGGHLLLSEDTAYTMCNWRLRKPKKPAIQWSQGRQIGSRDDVDVWIRISGFIDQCNDLPTILSYSVGLPSVMVSSVLIWFFLCVYLLGGFSPTLKLLTFLLKSTYQILISFLLLIAEFCARSAG